MIDTHGCVSESAHRTETTKGRLSEGKWLSAVGMKGRLHVLRASAAAGTRMQWHADAGGNMQAATFSAAAGMHACSGVTAHRHQCHSCIVLSLRHHPTAGYHFLVLEPGSAY